MIILLDRDGVINEDSAEFIKSPEEWRAIPGSLAAIAKLNRAGHRVVVVSNQSGVARGYFSMAVLLTIHHKMQNELAEAGGHLDGIYFCPHRSEDHCPCRKPKSGMLLQIANDFNVDLSHHGLLVGDSLRDIQAAQAIACPAALVKTGKGAATLAQGEGLRGVSIYDNLLQLTKLMGRLAKGGELG